MPEVFLFFKLLLIALLLFVAAAALSLGMRIFCADASEYRKNRRATHLAKLLNRRLRKPDFLLDYLRDPLRLDVLCRRRVELVWRRPWWNPFGECVARFRLADWAVDRVLRPC